MADNSRKRSKRTREGGDEAEDSDHRISDVPATTHSNSNVDHRLFDVVFPREYEHEFAAAIFELGLKHSSPKVLMPLMPQDSSLNTEHIKSHLQKYRIHKPRSREEFQKFYDTYLKDSFRTWELRRGWEHSSAPSSSTATHSTSITSTTTTASTTGLLSSQYLSHLTLGNTSSHNSTVSFQSLNNHLESLDNHPSHTNNNSFNSSSNNNQHHPSISEEYQLQYRQKLQKVQHLQELLFHYHRTLIEWRQLGTTVLDHTQDLRQDLVTATVLVDRIIPSLNNHSNNNHNNTLSYAPSLTLPLLPPTSLSLPASHHHSNNNDNNNNNNNNNNNSQNNSNNNHSNNHIHHDSHHPQQDITEKEIESSPPPSLSPPSALQLEQVTNTMSFDES
jgi:SHAQKYF class myb-like DNA-binding protein